MSARWSSWSEFRRGKTIWRVLANRALAAWVSDLRGIVLDLACGKDPSYWRTLGIQSDPRVQLVGLDRNPERRPTVVGDLTRPLPFRSGVADVVIVSSFLHIAPHPAAVLAEVRRVLRRGGTCILATNLVFPVTPEPTDYWRFTGHGLRLLLDEAGFGAATIVPIGGRWSAAAYLVEPFLRPRPLVPLVAYWLCLAGDAIASRLRTVTACPIGYVIRTSAPA